MQIVQNNSTFTLTAEEFRACHVELATLLNSLATGAESRLEYVEKKLREKGFSEATLSDISNGRELLIFSPLDEATLGLMSEYRQLSQKSA